jgi:hypothetical protein
MAKIIKITTDCLAEIRKDFEETLSSAKLSDGKISFSKSFGNIKRDATVFFTHEAWQKMQALIKGFDKEVAWHGLAYRGEEGKDEYYITDILVYPQEVTGATVNTDQEKYQMWLMSHEDDVFNNIRMQGHSHVNMGVTPSGVDNSLYERILEQLDDEMFYIFLIYNKKGDKTFKIYDLAKNILFETGDVTVKVLDDDADSVDIHVDGLSDDENEALSEFLVEYRTEKRMDEFTTLAKEMVKDKVTTPTRYGGNYGGNYGGGYGYGGYPNYGIRYQPTSNPPTPTTTPAPVQSSGKKRKGKRKGKNKGADKGGFQQLSMSNAYGYDDDDWDSPYSPFGYSDEYLRT